MRREHTYIGTLEFRRANFNKFREVFGGLAQIEVPKSKKVQDGWKLIRNKILKVQSHTV